MSTYVISSNIDDKSFRNNPNYFINIREEPNTTSDIIGQLDTYGTVVKKSDETKIGEYIWTQYIFSSGQIGWIRNDVHIRAELLTNGVLMNVPYVSQNDKDSDTHLNDCGVACALMGIKYVGKDDGRTVEQLANLLGMGVKSLTSFNHIFQLLKTYKVAYTFGRPFNLVDTIESLNSKTPIIQLVNYKYFNKGKTFPHFVVAKGYTDTHIIYNDPYDITNRQSYYLDYAKALALTIENGNYAYQSIVINNKKSTSPLVEILKTHKSNLENLVTDNDNK